MKHRYAGYYLDESASEWVLRTEIVATDAEAARRSLRAHLASAHYPPQLAVRVEKTCC